MFRKNIDESPFLKRMKKFIEIKKHELNLMEEGEEKATQLLSLNSKEKLLSNNCLDIDSFEECYAPEITKFSFISGNITEEEYENFILTNYTTYAHTIMGLI